jgi:hypothetical protein
MPVSYTRNTTQEIKPSTLDALEAILAQLQAGIGVTGAEFTLNPTGLATYAQIGATSNPATGTTNQLLTIIASDIGTTLNGNVVLGFGTSGTLHGDLAGIHSDLATTLHADLATTIHADLATTIHGDLATTIHADLNTTIHGDLATTLHGDVKSVGYLRLAGPKPVTVTGTAQTLAQLVGGGGLETGVKMVRLGVKAEGIYYGYTTPWTVANGEELGLGINETDCSATDITNNLKFITGGTSIAMTVTQLG